MKHRDSVWCARCGTWVTSPHAHVDEREVRARRSNHHLPEPPRGIDVGCSATRVTFGWSDQEAVLRLEGHGFEGELAKLRRVNAKLRGPTTVGGVSDAVVYDLVRTMKGQGGGSIHDFGHRVYSAAVQRGMIRYEDGRGYVVVSP